MAQVNSLPGLRQCKTVQQSIKTSPIRYLYFFLEFPLLFKKKSNMKRLDLFHYQIQKEKKRIN